MSSENNLTARLAKPADAEHFVEFNAAMALETEGIRLDRARLERGVRAVFDGGGRGFYVIAESDGDVAGGMLITPEWSDWRNSWFWWIQSVYVKPNYRRRGVYRAMHRFVENLGRERGDIWGLKLYVDENNHVAQKTYAELGMKTSHYQLYEIEFFSIE